MALTETQFFKAIKEGKLRQWNGQGLYTSMPWTEYRNLNPRRSFKAIFAYLKTVNPVVMLYRRRPPATAILGAK